MEYVWYVASPLAGVLLGWCLNEVSRWMHKPRLRIVFEYKRPCLFLGRVFRVKVVNKGRSVTANCVAKFSFTEANREDWREGEVLHWSRNFPEILRDVSKIYSPLSIAKGDYELLDVFYLSKPGYPFVQNEQVKNVVLHLYSYPSYQGSSRYSKVNSVTKLARYRIKKGVVYRGKVTVYCDNANPATLMFFFKFENGKLHVGLSENELIELHQCP